MAVERLTNDLSSPTFIVQESTFFILEELAPCINQVLTKLSSLNLQRDNDIIVKTIAKTMWCSVDFQCVKNLESFIKKEISNNFKEILKKLCWFSEYRNLYFYK